MLNRRQVFDLALGILILNAENTKGAVHWNREKRGVII